MNVLQSKIQEAEENLRDLKNKQEVERFAGVNNMLEEWRMKLEKVNSYKVTDNKRFHLEILGYCNGLQDHQYLGMRHVELGEKHWDIRRYMNSPFYAGSMHYYADLLEELLPPSTKEGLESLAYFASYGMRVKITDQQAVSNLVNYEKHIQQEITHLKTELSIAKSSVFISTDKFAIPHDGIKHYNNFVGQTHVILQNQLAAQTRLAN